MMAPMPPRRPCSPLARVARLCFVLAAGCTPAASPSTHPMSKHPEDHRPAVLGPEASAVDFDRIARFPEPGWHTPRNVAYAPDGKTITFLQGENGGDEMALFGFDLATRKARVLVRAADLARQMKPLSREEELRRERRRTRIHGVTDYRWARRAEVLVLPFGGDLFLRDEKGALTQLTDSPDPEIDPKLCDDGTRVAFVRGGELSVLDVRTRVETKLTQGAPEGVTRGLSDFIAQEEFDEESGFWWAPTCDRIAYLEVDERGVDLAPVLGYRKSRPDLMQQRYPRAGAKNALVRAGILDLATRQTTWITLPFHDERRSDGAASGPVPRAPAEHYLGRFQWSADGRWLWFQALSRDQQKLTVLRADATTGAAREVWSATSPTWIEFAKLRLLEKEARLVTTTVEGGHHHLELRDATTGARIRLLTSGDWEVDRLLGVDEARGQVLFTGSQASPVERRLCSAPLAGGPVVTLTGERGVHAVSLGRDGRTFVDEHSAHDRPPHVLVRSIDGATLGELPVPADPEIEGLRLRTPEIVEVQSPGGPTLYGALLKPRVMEPGRRYPAVVMVYGGPGVQMVLDQWAPRLLWQHLADRGFVVFQLDNRGSAGRGPGFQSAIHRHLGTAELADQLAGLQALADMPFVDPARVAIYGHSYGGFMAALAMLAAPGRFKVGIAGAPVTDWSLYDTGYTERYMGTPASNPAGYEGSDLARMAGNLQGRLLILHALMDENVHFTHTAHLADALVTAGKRFDMFVFPGERHGYRDPAARRYAMRRVVDYLIDHL
jgi:dipeptidyl-peptidase-4